MLFVLASFSPVWHSSRHENAVSEWRNTLEHCVGQRKGKSDLFHSYRIRVAKVVRDYTESDRTEAPTDSNRELS